MEDDMRGGGLIERKTSAAALLLAAAVCAVWFGVQRAESAKSAARTAKTVVVTSDSILMSMAEQLLPGNRYEVTAILPPGQCPGHYDVKLSDIEKVKKADLVITFLGMTFMDKADDGGVDAVLIDAKGRNWMSPDAYTEGLSVVAGELAKRFPADKSVIMKRRAAAAGDVKKAAAALVKKIKKAGIYGTPVIASSMQKEPLEWFGFRVVGEYGRPESISAKEIVRLTEAGRKAKAALVVDNLQSGPDTGESIAEALKASHVVLTNFPSEKGYVATLRANVDALAAAAKRK